MTDLLALAARVEAAKVADRDLDWNIFHAAKQGHIAEGFEHLTPEYTQSLDAAMTLVPEGSGMQLHRYWIARVDGPVWYGMVTTSYSSETVVLGTHHHEAWDLRNAALAITAAALRARAAIEGGT